MNDILFIIQLHIAGADSKRGVWRGGGLLILDREDVETCRIRAKKQERGISQEICSNLDALRGHLL